MTMSIGCRRVVEDFFTEAETVDRGEHPRDRPPRRPPAVEGDPARGEVRIVRLLTAALVGGGHRAPARSARGCA